ncbi:MAG: orotate phosphoribosyltransferase [Deltaproteobacteria bacterium]|nr:orotate phosphoribosyltransferase [Deltaproteobacteria bacterium]
MLKRRLIEIILERSFQFNEEPTFRLVSGKKSRYYFNCKATTLHPEGMVLIGRIGFERIRELVPRGVGGLTLGADPLAYAVSFHSALAGAPIETFIVRKEAKKHGLMRKIEGNVRKGDRVVVVDDVVTTGGSTLQAVEAAQSAGFDVVRILTLVDRQEGGRENIEKTGIPFEAILTRDEVMEVYRGR